MYGARLGFQFAVEVSVAFYRETLAVAIGDKEAKVPKTFFT